MPGACPGSPPVALGVEDLGRHDDPVSGVCKALVRPGATGFIGCGPGAFGSLWGCEQPWTVFSGRKMCPEMTRPPLDVGAEESSRL